MSQNGCHWSLHHSPKICSHGKLAAKNIIAGSLCCSIHRLKYKLVAVAFCFRFFVSRHFTFFFSLYDREFFFLKSNLCRMETRLSKVMTKHCTECIVLCRTQLNRTSLFRYNNYTSQAMKAYLSRDDFVFFPTAAAYLFMQISSDEH